MSYFFFYSYVYIWNQLLVFMYIVGWPDGRDKLEHSGVFIYYEKMAFANHEVTIWIHIY